MTAPLSETLVDEYAALRDFTDEQVNEQRQAVIDAPLGESIAIATAVTLVIGKFTERHPKPSEVPEEARALVSAILKVSDQILQADVETKPEVLVSGEGELDTTG